MDETQLALWKEISDNIALIFGTLSGAVIAVLIASIQARWQFKQTKYKETISMNRAIMKEYFSQLYSYLRVGKFDSGETRPTEQAKLLIAQAALLPLLRGEHKDALLNLTNKALYGSVSNDDVQQFMKSLKY